ncbi:YjbF family lipoprotein [Gammaproteobacteria bacterium]|nr:YjbF family lipoprotein [Gammaproteobacteria bacterium]
MIRLAALFYLIFLSACSALPMVKLDLGYVTLFREGLSSNNIEVDAEFKNQMVSSFIKITQGKNQAIFVLRSSVAGVEKWIGSNSESLITFKGLIIETSGLNQNFKLHHQQLDQVYLNHLVTDYEVTASITNPLLPSTLLDLNILKIAYGAGICSEEIKYVRLFKALSSNFTDVFCLDKSKKVIRSVQQLSPLEKEIVIDFYYKY